MHCNMQYKDESEYESEWALDSDYDEPMSARMAYSSRLEEDISQKREV